MQDPENAGVPVDAPFEPLARSRWAAFRRFWCRRDAFFVLILAVYASLFGLTSTEMEFHEIYVVQTAAEMQERGDYLVPYFNGELRLTKPPMNYWLTAASAWMRGEERPREFDARFPSALAGIALVIITILLGSELWSRAVGLNAGVILCGSFGFVDFTHSARPEMVYAAFSVGCFLCFVASWRRNGHSGLPWLGWVLFALAVLTKGPQIPALMLGGLALGLAFHQHTRRSLARIFRPVRGVLIVALLASWWWIAIRLQVGAATLADSQLFGSRFLLGLDAWSNPAYFYLFWFLLLPWVFLFVPMLRASVNRGSKRAAAARTMLTVLLATAVILNFGHDKRPHYLLPILPIASTLMALGMRGFLKRVSARCSASCVRVLVLAFASIAIAGSLAARILLPSDVHESHLNLLLGVNVLGIIVATGAMLRPARLRKAATPFGVPVMLQWAGVVSVAFSTSMVLTYLLSSTRLHPRSHTADLVAAVPQDAVLVSIGVEPHYIIYYARRRVVSLESLDRFLAMNLDSAWIVTDEPTARALARDGIENERGRVQDCVGEVDWVLLQWKSGQATSTP